MNQAAMRLAETLSQAETAHPSAAGSGEGSSNDKVVDAEFEEVDNSNRQAG